MPRAQSLFDEPPSLPEGFVHREDFLSTTAEARLLEFVTSLEFHDVKMHGVVARRRVVQYGWKYSFDSHRMTQGPDLPEDLRAVRDDAAVLAGLPAEELSEALVTEYTPGATIGWHRDAPGFGVVVGVSVLGACRFKLRREREDGGWEMREVALHPRSAYVLTGPSRSEWQHSIPAVRELRYSITFRTLKRAVR
jgi:alkylated DNA repair dioxygenase AlkB